VRVIASPSFSVSWNHGLQRFKVGGTSDRMPSCELSQIVQMLQTTLRDDDTRLEETEVFL